MFNIPPHSFHVMVVVMILLVVGTSIRLFLAFKNRKKGTSYRELRQRTQSWWWMIVILFLSLSVGKTLTLILFAFISFLALKEFFSIVPTRMADRRVIFWAYLSIPIQYYLVAISWYAFFLVFIPIYLFLFLSIRMVMIGETKGFITSVGIIHWAVMLTVFCFSHLGYLLQIPELNKDAGNIGMVIFIIFMTEFNDVCQYIFGKTLGKNKIVPKVSPNKTWEGFLGGVVMTTIIASVLGPYLTPLNTWQSLFLGLVIAFAGFMGDVVLSSIKRDLEIKDTGTLIPGHGGMLDRMDSLFFTAPLFFHLTYYLAY